MTLSVESIKNRYRLDIDGLRAIAVLSVFLFHLNPTLYPGGFLGVDVFFVISGYLITGIIIGEMARGSFSFQNFFARRIKRIFPALFGVVFVTGCIATFLLTPESYSTFLDSARYASGQLANIFFAREVGYFNEGFNEQPLLHTWSLGVEEQFYLFWPFLIFLLYKALRRGAAGVGGFDHTGARILFSKATLFFFIMTGAVSFILCFVLADFTFQLAFYMFYSRAWEFCFGAILALKIIPSPKTENGRDFLGFVGLLFLGVSFFFVEHYFLGLSFLKFGALLPCFGASCIILAAQSHPCRVNRVLSTKPPVFIGKISYSLYLYHWPAIIFYTSLTAQHELTLSASLTIFLVALICSVLSYYCIEQPCRKLAVNDKYVFTFAAFLIICFVATFDYLDRFKEAEWRIKPYAVAEETAPPIIPRGCTKQNYEGLTYYDCRLTDDVGAPTLALVGDSHSPHYSHGVVSWAKENGANVIFLSIPGCPMVLGDVSIKSMMDSHHEEQCRVGLPFFNSLVYDNPSVKWFFIAQRFDLFYDGKGFLSNTPQIIFTDQAGKPIVKHRQYYEQQLDYTLNEIRQQGKDVLLFKQVPVLGNTKACNWEPAIKEVLGMERACWFDQSFITKWQQPSIDFVDQFARQHDVSTVDPFGYIRSPLQDGVNIYSNIDHLNTYGFDYLVPFVKKELDDKIGNYKP